MNPYDMNYYRNDPRFNDEQLDQLRRGLDLDLPVHLYANPHFPCN